jgi:hypothetical protein
MSRIERPKVEDLSDLQWARIERAVWQRLDSSPAMTTPTQAPRRWRGLRPVALGAVALVAVAATLLIWLRAPASPERGDGAETFARLVTEDSPTTISFSDASISIAPRTAVLLHRDSSTVVIERGSASFAVAARLQRPAFLVVAGDATVRVVGTRFQVQRRADEVTVSVQEGKVEVLYRGEVHSVFAGASWTSVPPAPAAAAPVDRIDLLEDSSLGDTAPEAAPAPASADKPVRRRRSPEPTQAVSPQEISPRALFEAATKLEPSEPQEAMRQYLQLSSRDDAWGANALFAAVRLAFDTGRPERARDLARRYLRRFPTGANLADVKLLLDGAAER